MKNPELFQNSRMAVFGARVQDKSPGQITVKKGNSYFQVIGDVDSIPVGKYVSLKLMYLHDDVFRLLFVHTETYRTHRQIVSIITVLIAAVVFFKHYSISPGNHTVFVEKPSKSQKI